MSSTTKFNESETLEAYRVALENAQTQPKILTALSEIGFGKEKITEGQAILKDTRATYDKNAFEDIETSRAFQKFRKKREELYKTYRIDRKKALVIFYNEPSPLEELGIPDSMPRTYLRWFEAARKFYTTASENSGIQERLAELNITTEHLKEALNLIGEVESARSDWLREKGESQDATQLKDEAFNKIDDWMRRFYAVSRIALEDNPQLLEAVGKVIR
jgi:hypothetical protein